MKNYRIAALHLIAAVLPVFGSGLSWNPACAT